MPIYEEVLSLAKQLPLDDQDRLLSTLIALRRNLMQGHGKSLSRRALLSLAPEERDRILAQQVPAITPYFQPGTEDVEWVESFVEDDE